MDQDLTQALDILLKFFPLDLVMLSASQGILLGFFAAGVGVTLEFLFAPHGTYAHAVRSASAAGADADRLEVEAAVLEGDVSAARLQLQSLLNPVGLLTNLGSTGPPDVLADPLHPPSTT